MTNSQQCEHCKRTLNKFSIVHETDRCPFVRGRFCMYCSVYGHGSDQCSFKPPSYLLKPQYIEQLISPTERIQRGIKTLTPFKDNMEESLKPKRKIVSFVSIKYRLETMKEFAKVRGISLKMCRTKEPMRKLIENYATEHELNIKFV